MRHGMIAAAGFFACCAIGVAQAEDVSEQGAGELRKNLMHMLSDDLAKSGFLEIRPAGGVSTGVETGGVPIFPARKLLMLNAST